MESGNDRARPAEVHTDGRVDADYTRDEALQVAEGPSSLRDLVADLIECRAEINDWRSGLIVVKRYPCGCSATGARSIPDYCPKHDSPLVSESHQRRQFPIPLNAEQEQAAKEWAADDRLWATQETVEFNLRTFARKILAVTESHPSDRLRALDLEAIKAREAAATKGPWRSMLAGNCNMENGLLAAIAEVEGLPRPWNPVWVGWQSAKNYFKTFLRKEDAEFVARSREDVPALIAEVERLRVIVRASQPSEGWQDIATAPKDGTRILLARKQIMSGEVVMLSGSWNSGGAMHMPYWMTPLLGFQPTHWTPLPAPPSLVRVIAETTRAYTPSELDNELDVRDTELAALASPAVEQGRLQALIERWRNRKPTNDLGESYDRGRHAAYEMCADELLEVLGAALSVEVPAETKEQP